VPKTGMCRWNRDGNRNKKEVILGTPGTRGGACSACGGPVWGPPRVRRDIHGALFPQKTPGLVDMHSGIRPDPRYVLEPRRSQNFQHRREHGQGRGGPSDLKSPHGTDPPATFGTPCLAVLTPSPLQTFELNLCGRICTKPRIL